MLQRQIMFKQLQELQRRQQLQELGGPRNQDYINQLASFKQAAGVQFHPTVNGTPNDSQTLMFGNMQMMQHGGSDGSQWMPNGMVFSQSHNNAVGLQQPQFDLFGTPSSNTDKNLNQHSPPQMSPHHSANMMTKNSNSPLGMSSMHPSNFGSSLSMPDGSMLHNQVFQEKNLFGQVPGQSFNGDFLSHNYSQQVVSQPAASLDPLEQKILYNTDDNSWELSISGKSKLGTGGFESTVENPSYVDALPSIQSGSWSALMQSAVAETSSSDTGIQEEWSGLSFQNPEPSIDNQHSNLITSSEKPQNNWVDRNSQHVSSPSSKSENLFQNSDMNCSFPGFQAESFHASNQHSPKSMSQLADYNSQQKHSAGGGQLNQTSLPSFGAWPVQYKEHLEYDSQQPSVMSCTNVDQSHHNFSGREGRGSLWPHGNTSNPLAAGIQKPFDQVNQLNINKFVEPSKIAPRDNVDIVSSLLSNPRGQNVAAQSESMLELLNKEEGTANDDMPRVQLNSNVSTNNGLALTEASVASFAKPCTPPAPQGFSFRQGPADPGTPQSYSFFPSFSMGNSSATSLSGYNVNDYFKEQHPASPVQSHVAAKFPAYSNASSLVNFQRSVTPVVSQHAGSSTVLPTPWAAITTQQDISSTKPYKSPSNLYRSIDSASSSRETSSGAPDELPSKNSFGHEYSAQEFGTYSGKSEKSSSLTDGFTETQSPMPLSRSTRNQELSKKHQSETDVASGSLGTHPHQQPSNQQRYNEAPAFSALDIRGFGNSVSQNQSLLHQVYSLRNAETDKLPLKFEDVNYQQAVANARELLLSGQRSANTDEPKSNLNAVSQLGTEACDVNYQQAVANARELLLSGQRPVNNDEAKSNLNAVSQLGIEASNVMYQPQISLQMAPNWFKHYGTLNNGKVLPIYDPKAAVSAAKPFSGMTLGTLQENSFMRQVNSVNASQASGIWPPETVNLVTNKLLPPPSMTNSEITSQQLAVTTPKKRKIAFDMVPWHKEVNQEPSRLQHISISELEWAQASNRRPEEAKIDDESVEDMIPLVRSKRRLIIATQLTQQVFRPAPAVVLFADANSYFNCVAYSAARLALGDACNLTNKLSSDTDDVSPDKLKTSKRNSACDFSKVVESLISQVKKLEGDLSRVERSLSLVDIKVEAHELEKFSTINRFAKFHIKAQPITVDPSGTSTVLKSNIQKYVAIRPMPKTEPEGVECLSL